MKPEKGSVVAVWYTGKLEDGTVFDSNVENARKKDRKALKFKVGTGRFYGLLQIKFFLMETISLSVLLSLPLCCKV